MTLTSLWSDEVEARVRAEARNLDTQERPEHVQFCTRCVVSNQRPRIVFDEDGVCSACRYAERKRNGDINWDTRAAELGLLLDKHRRSSGYDVIVPCSGGKDSAMIAHRLKHEYGMHPLCVKFPPFMYTEIGKRNWETFKACGFDAVEERVDELTHRRLARLNFEYLGDPFGPFVYGQMSYPIRITQQLDVPLVMYGENGEAEYGGDQAANDKPCWDEADWDRIYHKSFGLERIQELGYELPDLQPYRMPLRTLRGTTVHWWSHYHLWHPQENYYYAAEHCGFEANDERSEGTYSKYASLDDKLDGLHYYMALVKFGIGRATSDAAHEVRDGDITREDAVALVMRYDREWPERYLSECVDYLGMDAAQLNRVIGRFRPQHLWAYRSTLDQPQYTEPILRYAVWHQEAA